MPSYKYQGVSLDIMKAQDEETFNKTLREAYYSQTNETIMAVSYAYNYISAVQTVGALRVEDVTVPTILDWVWFGFCATISFERLRNQKTIQGDNGKDDFEYMTIAWLRGDNLGEHKDKDGMTFLIKVHQPGETVVNGAFGVIIVENIRLPLQDSILVAVDYEYEKKMRKCDPSNQLMTTCLDKYFEKKYGNGWQALRLAKAELSDIKIFPPERLTNRTGCQVSNNANLGSLTLINVQS